MVHLKVVSHFHNHKDIGLDGAANEVLQKFVKKYMESITLEFKC